jgi:hypothetical protein
MLAELRDDSQIDAKEAAANAANVSASRFPATSAAWSTAPGWR